MQVAATLDAPCTVGDLVAQVDDLERYVNWLTIVPRVDRLDDDDKGRPVWMVELRGRVGPLARSKRLRMVRTTESREGDATHIRFERVEHPPRSHSPWVLDVRVRPDGKGSHLDMSLHYGGRFAGSLLEGLLRDEIEASRPRLLALVTPGVR
jgi:hypothetical protein